MKSVVLTFPMLVKQMSRVNRIKTLFVLMAFSVLGNANTYSLAKESFENKSRDREVKAQRYCTYERKRVRSIREDLDKYVHEECKGDYYACKSHFRYKELKKEYDKQLVRADMKCKRGRR